ncbi:KAP family NTPase [Desulfobaculum bizertense]|uniref:P-loop NTPase fold protein n=1 Tax=Desulfobaculum bizertense TaxID=376490 RepID=UPI001F32D9EF|nr:P-loop NTPase fold protein [Desulfobaculum bizertense]UIJ39428.1 KAP family NTPase [Desulfobaculum bizertense]
MTIEDWVREWAWIVLYLGAVIIYLDSQTKKDEMEDIESEIETLSSEEKSLQRYILSKGRVSHAVMLTGPWGSGKTYFMNLLIEKLSKVDQKIRWVQVSLFGISSVEELEEELFRVMHPKLSSKPALIGKALARTILNGAWRVKITDADTKQFDFKELVSHFFNRNNCDKGNNEKLVFVFDDLERCDAYLNDVFGKINTLVEGEGRRVILIANEEKVEKRGNEYLYLVEKVVAKRIKLKCDSKPIIKSIICNLKECEEVREIFTEKTDVIAGLMSANDNKAQNFRILKTFVYEFELLWNVIDEEFKKHTDFWDRFFVKYYKFYFLIRAGIIGQLSIVDLERQNNTKSPGENEKLDEIKESEKYWSDLFEINHLPSEFWDEVLRGDVTEKRIQYWLVQFDELRIERPWIKIQDYFQLSDEEFKKLIQLAWNDLSNGKIDDVLDLSFLAKNIEDFYNDKIFDKITFERWTNKLCAVRDDVLNLKINEKNVGELASRLDLYANNKLRKYKNFANFVSPIKYNIKSLKNTLMQDKVLTSIRSNDYVSVIFASSREDQPSLNIIPSLKFVEFVNKESNVTLYNIYRIINEGSIIGYTDSLRKEALVWIDIVLKKAFSMDFQSNSIRDYHFRNIERALENMRERLQNQRTS